MQSIPKLDKSPLWQRYTCLIDPIKFFETVTRQHLDLCGFEGLGFGNEDIILVNHPKAIKKILSSDHQKLFASSKNHSIFSPILGDRSLILLEDNPHRQRRKLLLPPFHRKSIATHSQSIVELTNQVFGSLSANQSFSARDLAQDIALQVMLRVVYGISKSDKLNSIASFRAQELKRLIFEMANVFRSPLTSALLFFPKLRQDWGAWSPWGYFLRVRKAIDKLIDAEIADRREQDNIHGEDILSMLMSARDEAGQPMSDSELRDELRSLMFAGHENTATAIAWALY
jgi:cytochrome P450 family 110